MANIDGSQVPRIERQPNPHAISIDKRWLGGGLALLMAATGGVLAFKALADDDTQGKSLETNAIEDNPDTAPEEPSAPVIAEETPAKEKSTIPRGLVNLDTVAGGNDDIVALRPNGEEIKVPLLKNGSQEEVFNSALLLLSCYLTTGDNGCLEAFSPNDDVQQHLIQWREERIEPVINDPAHPENVDTQFTFFDDPADPITLQTTEVSAGLTRIELLSGTLYSGPYINTGGDNSWQTTETRQYGVLSYQIPMLQLELLTSATDELIITGFAYETQAVE